MVQGKTKQQVGLGMALRQKLLKNRCLVVSDQIYIVSMCKKDMTVAYASGRCILKVGRGDEIQIGIEKNNFSLEFPQTDLKKVSIQLVPMNCTSL